MEIEHIKYFLGLLLLLPVAVLLFTTIRWKKNTVKKLGDHALVKQLIAGYAPKKFLAKGILSLAALVLLVLALVNFRKPDSSEKVKLNGTDLMIALDVSNSMMAKDIQPNRLEKAKLLISKLIDQLEGNRLGLVVFAGNAYLQMPLTTDAAAAKLFLSTINPGLVPLQGTNISDALKRCDQSLNTEEKKYKSILLISDGEDHDDAAIATAKELKDKGVIINTIGVGSPEGAPITDSETNEAKRDDQGNIVVSKLNQEELKNIAAASNGTYQLLGEADAAAKSITSQLQGMDKKPITDRTLTNYTSYFWIFILLALIILLAETIMGDKKRTPKRKKQIINIKEEKEIPMAKKAAVTAILLLMTGSSSQVLAQKENELVRKGNEAYKQQKFEEAGKDYEAAIKQNVGNNTAIFNLGNSWYKNGKYEEAVKQYDALAANKNNKQLQSQSLYNKGVSLVKQKKLEEAIEAFKQSLQVNPKDEQTRENLQKALNEKQQQDQQDKKDDKKDDKKKQDDKKKDDKKEDKKEDQQKDKKDQQQQDKEDKEQQQQQKPKISKQDAEQKLEALRQEEKKLQQKLNQKQKSNIKQPEKDW